MNTLRAAPLIPSHKLELQGIRVKLKKSQQGASLLEVMIAGLLFMVGLLGLLATQGLAMKLSNASVLDTSATILVSDLYDRIKANPTAMEAGYYSTANFKSADWKQAKDCSNVTLICTPTEQAAYDLAHWKVNLQTNFPSAVEATIARVAGSSQYEIELIWQEQLENDANNDGVEDKTSTNCAKGQGRPANERAVCAMLDFGSMGVF